MGKRKNQVSHAKPSYVVEKVLDSYSDIAGNTWYLLKWAGYSEADATWEPKTNLDCTSLIKDYENKKLLESQWSLKCKTGGSCTKIVLKKVPSSSSTANDDGLDSEITKSTLPKRQNKRRRSSTIGKVVSSNKKKKQPNKEAQQPKEEEYYVEAILDKCLDASGRILYLIKWVGWDSIYNTWEPVEHLNCSELLQDFNSKNRLPKVVVSKILDKRLVVGNTEYLCKVAGCRKNTWIKDSDLQCSELIKQYNDSTNAKKKITIADIADQASDDDDVPKPVSTGGVKVNKDCMTSSDEDEPSYLVTKKLSAINGSTRYRSNSSSSSNIDFDDLIRRIDESKTDDQSVNDGGLLKKRVPLKQNKLSPKEEVIPLNSMKPDHSMKGESLDDDNMKKFNLAPYSLPKIKFSSHKKDKELPPDVKVTLKHEPVSPKCARNVYSDVNKTPLYDSDDNSTSSDSLSDIEADLTKALEAVKAIIPTRSPSEPVTEHSINLPKTDAPNNKTDGFTGVDLGALILDAPTPNKSMNESQTDILSAIVSQSVHPQDEGVLESAFLNTSLAKNSSHSELYSVVTSQNNNGEDSTKPNDTEIDSVLDAIYSQSVPTDSLAQEVNEPTNEPEDDAKSTELGDAANNTTPVKTSSPSKPITPPSPPFKSFISTFTDGPKRSRGRTKKPKLIPKSEDSAESDLFSSLAKPSRCRTTASQNQTFNCQFCKSKFKNKDKLEYHLSYKHPQMLELLCDSCDEFFPSAVEYQCHQLTCHK